MSRVLGGNPSTVSVIVTVRSQRAHLARCLDALEAQGVGGMEVVVVDDGSTDRSGDLAAARCVGGRPVLVARGDRRGDAAARDVGAAAAGAPVLAFTGWDCEPDPAWLATALDAVADGADLVHGPTVAAGAAPAADGSGLFPATNVVYRRAAFDAAGGFDPGAARRLGVGEDARLGWRVVRAGGDVRYRAGAVVRRAPRPAGVAEAARRAGALAAFPALLAEVPELRDRYGSPVAAWRAWCRAAG